MVFGTASSVGKSLHITYDGTLAYSFEIQLDLEAMGEDGGLSLTVLAPNLSISRQPPTCLHPNPLAQRPAL
jgi:hypothetical protein